MKTPPELVNCIHVFVAKTGFCWFLSFQSSRNRTYIFERKKKLVRNIGSFEKSSIQKSGVKLQCLTEANPRETTSGSKNREF